MVCYLTSPKLALDRRVDCDCKAGLTIESRDLRLILNESQTIALNRIVFRHYGKL